MDIPQRVLGQDGRKESNVMELYIDGTGQRIHVHDKEDCQGHDCVVHSPSNHHMRGWATHYRRDRGFTERVCVHGVGHIDPDDMSFLRGVYESKGKDHSHLGIHGCDGCCSPSTNQDLTNGDLIKKSILYKGEL